MSSIEVHRWHDTDGGGTVCSRCNMWVGADWVGFLQDVIHKAWWEMAEWMDNHESWDSGELAAEALAEGLNSLLVCRQGCAS